MRLDRGGTPCTINFYGHPSPILMSRFMNSHVQPTSLHAENVVYGGAIRFKDKMVVHFAYLALTGLALPLKFTSRMKRKRLPIFLTAALYA
jgi:hypothetical protein